MTFLRYLFSCKGRMGRKGFIFAQLSVLCVFLGLGWALSVHSREELVGMLTNMGSEFAFLLGVAALAFLVVGIWSACIAWPMRRLHDMGKSGSWAVVLVVLSLLPIEEELILLAISLIEVVFFLYLLFKKGQDGENEYGLPQM